MKPILHLYIRAVISAVTRSPRAFTGIKPEFYQNRRRCVNASVWPEWRGSSAAVRRPSRLLDLREAGRIDGAVKAVPPTQTGEIPLTIVILIQKS